MKKMILFLIMFFCFIWNIYASDYIIYINPSDWWKIYSKNANDIGNGIAINNM